MRRSSATDAVFKALADPTRRRILSLLRERRRSVGEIASNFRVSRPAISKHLRLLRDAGLVVDRPEGTTRMCELNAAPLQQIDAWLEVYKTFLGAEPRTAQGPRGERKMTTTDSSTTIVREITIDAPAAKIFAALTDPDQLVQWWGDDEIYRCTNMERDLRVGGKWRTTGRDAQGKSFAVEGLYRVIDPPRVL